MRYFLLFIWFSFSICKGFSQVADYNFFKPKQETLPQNVNCIFEDKLGFIWIGTTQGLYLFDGIDYKIYRYQPGNDNSLCNNYVTGMIEDGKGQIWIATFGGLSRYDRKSDIFYNYFHNEQDSASICHDQIKSFLIDKRSRLWIASANGLNLYNPESDDFRQFKEYLPENIKIGRNITCLQEDKYGMIWIGTWNAGLIRYNPEQRKFLHYSYGEGNLGEIQSNQIISLAHMNDSILWIGHYENGLGSLNLNTLKFDYSKYERNRNLLGSGIRKLLVDHQKNIWIITDSKLLIYNNKSGDFINYSNAVQKDGSHFPQRPQYLFEDSNNLIWVYSDDDGLMYCHPSANNFLQYYNPLPNDISDVKQNYVTSMVQDLKGNLWLATFDNGVIKKLKGNQKFLRFRHSPDSPEKTINSNRANHLFLDKKGLIWVSTSNGISVINPESNSVENKIPIAGHGKDGILHPFVNTVFGDSEGNIWILQQEGLDYYITANNTFKHFNQSDLGGFSHYKFTSVAEDNEGNIWLGTFKGLNKYNLKTGAVKQYIHDPANRKAISNSYIESLTFSKEQGKLWIGTQDGLNLYEKETDSFISFSSLPGIASNYISGVLNEDSLNLWLITDVGLSKLNLNTREVLNYGSMEGVSTNTAAFYKSLDGRLFFGGAHDNYYSFLPDSVKFNASPPPVFIIDFLLFNKSNPVSTLKRPTPLKENIQTAKEICLKHNENSFGFEFTALNYLFPEKNQYAYKLEGFDLDWNYTDYKRRFANYTNLSPGKYRLVVIASNNDGVWNRKGAVLTIIISPPYWKTGFAYFIYFISLAFLIFFARYYTTKQTRLKSSLAVEHLLREKEQEAHKQRIIFFTNISHEFRTPLTLISGPLKQLVHFSNSLGWNQEVNSYLGLIHRNVKRLTDLTNQLLDFRKIESGKMKIELSKGDLVQFINRVSSGFDELAHRKNLKISFSSEIDELIAFFDSDKLEKILFNLIGNAIKFTKKGEIKVRLKLNKVTKSDQGRIVELSVEDTGIGIADDQLKQIFNPFHQVEDAKIPKNEGTGLGLALVQSIVQICGGEIIVTSKVGKGSIFTVALPVDRQETEEMKLQSLNKEENSGNNVLHDELISGNTKEIADSNQHLVKEKPMLLVIEDNSDMRLYIKKVCSQNYQMIETENGESGIKKAFESIPDIIISDLMMPGISGMEVTKTLKSDMRTSHIPIILLTALSSVDHKIEGLSKGADDYITKPFNEELLNARLENLLQNRRKLREYYQKQFKTESFSKNISAIQPKDLVVENIDEKFIMKVLDIIEMHMGETDFGVDYLSREIGMEASTLYKKMMALIEMPPGEFIRDIRLKRASHLLAQKHLSISDISYMIGYDEPKYFSKIFKKHCGFTPTEYRTKISESNDSSS